jgi:regulator of protease activity HflC (stomatin/prohibitin superfamily)
MNTIPSISPNANPWTKKLIIGLACAVGLYVAAPFTVVPTGNRGILTTFGNPSDTVYDTGLHFRIPLVQKMYLMNVQIQAAEGEGDAASKDMQSVQTRVAINYHLDPKSAVDAYINIGPSTDIVAQRIIIPATHESVKAITARFTAEELITQRTAVRDAIATLLREKMARHGLVLDEFNLVNFAFSKSFSDAIENKVKAEQQKQQAERDLQRLQVEAQQKIVAAKAEAESLALQRQQITTELLALRRIENERLAINKWDGKLPTVTSGATPFINIDKSK